MLLTGYDKKDTWEEDITKNFEDGEFNDEKFDTPLECGRMIVKYFNATRPNDDDPIRCFFGVKVWEGEIKTFKN